MKAQRLAEELLAPVLRVAMSHAAGSPAFLSRWILSREETKNCSRVSSNMSTWRTKGVRYFPRTGDGKLAYVEQGW